MDRYPVSQSEDVQIESSSWLSRFRNRVSQLPPVPRLDLSGFFKSKLAVVRERRSSTVDSFGQAASVAFALNRKVRSRSSLTSRSHERESVVVSLNSPEENHKRGFCSNYVSTTRYRWWSFVPQNLYEQFRRWVMMYFLAYLIINILSGVFPQIAVYSTPNGVSVTAIVPLSLVVGITMIKAAIEDIFRLRNDLKANSMKFQTVRDGFRVSVKSSHIRVGDIIVLQDGDIVPADIVALSAAREDGVVFLETSALDGETNLKRFLVLSDTSSLTNDAEISSLRGEIRCEPPSINMNSFAGIVKLEQVDPVGGTRSRVIEKPISKDNLLLRGAVVRNSGWLYGIVIYAEINRVYVVCFSYLILWCFALGLAAVMGILGFFANVVMSGTVVPIAAYITLELARAGLLIFLHWDESLVTYRKKKKVSLASLISEEAPEEEVSETVKIRAEVRNSDLETELGQVGHVFSDKTGTLTMNIMEFRRCYVKGNVFEFDSSTRQFHHIEGKPENCKVVDFAEMLRAMALCHSVLTNNVGLNSSSDMIKSDSPMKPVSPKRHLSSNVTLDTFGYRDARDVLHRKRSYLGVGIEDAPNISSAISNSPSVASRYQAIFVKWKRKWSSLFRPSQQGTIHSSDKPKDSLDNKLVGTASVDMNEQLPYEKDPLDPKNVSYEGTNTDEMEFVKTAALSGYRLAMRTRDNILLEEVYRKGIFQGYQEEQSWKPCTNGNYVSYSVLATCEFSSDRKRMSIIVQTPENRILLLVKGAESVIFPRLKQENREEIETANFQVEKFAKEGLRTLVFAERELSPEFYQEWIEKLNHAELALYERESKIYEVWELLECDLSLVGVTAVEDRLQDDVPETISYLRQCGIRIWLLTGDKRETAVNVGVLSGLIGPDSAVYDLTAQTERDMESQLESFESLEDLCQEIEMDRDCSALDDMESRERMDDWNSGMNGHSGDEPVDPTSNIKKTRRTLVVEGDALSFALLRYAKEFVSLATRKFDSVICCRTKPMDKAWVVRTCKKYHPDITLSVGDGGNDVPMILEAHVGVGIAGYEGAQASRSSDFSIGEFRHLRRLIALYGRYANVGISQCLKAIFYKDFVIFTGLLWYNIWCQFSVEAIANTYYELLYDLLYTGLAPLVLGWFERDVPASAVLRYPAVYKSKSEFNLKSTIPWLLSGFWHSLVLSFVPVLALYNSADATDIWNPQGFTFGLSSLIIMFQIGVEVVVLSKISLETLRWTWVNVLGIVFCLACFLVYLILFTTDFFTSTSAFLGNDLYWTWYNEMSSSAYFYFVVLVTVALCLLPDFFIQGYRNVYRPRFWMVVRQEAIKEQKKSRQREVVGDPVSSPAS
ncbi:Probable phospholipid-transporting ATPase 5 [Galdieria sulphuraria]|nr:Probable phospholipid-transporting ATPase 5 [Galdieria sulphuraria]